MKKISTFLVFFLLLCLMKAGAVTFTANTTLTTGTYNNPKWAAGITITIASGATVNFTGAIDAKGNLTDNGTLNIYSNITVGQTLTVGPSAKLNITANLKTNGSVLFDKNSTSVANNYTSNLTTGQTVELKVGAKVTVYVQTDINSGSFKMDAGSAYYNTSTFNINKGDNNIAGVLNAGGSLNFKNATTTMACPGVINVLGSLNNNSSVPPIEGKGFILVIGFFNGTHALTNSSDITLNRLAAGGSGNKGAATDGWASKCDATLNVNLKSFTGNKDGNAVKLQWITATEVNNKEFTVERSIDGTNYQQIATVPTKATNGFSSSDISYEAMDNNPNAGNNIYRLKQTDISGTVTYYKLTSSVNFSSNAISIYPNPATSYIQVSGNEAGDKFRVVSVAGISVLTTDNNRININGLAQGVYFLQVVRNNQAVKTLKFIKN